MSTCKITYTVGESYALNVFTGDAKGSMFAEFTGPRLNQHILNRLIRQDSRLEDTKFLTENPLIDLVANGKISMYYDMDPEKCRALMMLDKNVVDRPSDTTAISYVYFRGTQSQINDCLLDGITTDVEVSLNANKKKLKRAFIAFARIIIGNCHGKYHGSVHDRSITFKNSSLAEYWTWMASKLSTVPSFGLTGEMYRDDGMFNVQYYNSCEDLFSCDCSGDVVESMKNIPLDKSQLISIILFLNAYCPEQLEFSGDIVMNTVRNAGDIQSIFCYPYLDLEKDLSSAIYAEHDINDDIFRRYTQDVRPRISDSDWPNSVAETREALKYFLKGYGLDDMIDKIRIAPKSACIEDRLMITRCICDVKGATCIRHSDPIPLPEDATYGMKVIHRMLYGDFTSVTQKVDDSLNHSCCNYRSKGSYLGKYLSLGSMDSDLKSLDEVFKTTDMNSRLISYFDPFIAMLN